MGNGQSDCNLERIYDKIEETRKAVFEVSEKVHGIEENLKNQSKFINIIHTRSKNNSKKINGIIILITFASGALGYYYGLEKILKLII